jgi:predicted unusual protein kinase regulating ubiquinone biosynthesis (AarF/ABC1/UbiB family)
MTLGDVSERNRLAMLQGREYLLYEPHFRIPAQFAFNRRAIGTLADVATGLAPGINFVEVASPCARTFLGRDAESVEQAL